MNDETKAAVEEFRRRFSDPMANRVLDWIDGEPARLAAKAAEQHAIDVDILVTPLADELRTLRAALERATEGVRYWTDLAQAEARDAAALRARDVEDHPGGALLIAEVAALRARVAELEALAWPGEHRHPDQSYRAMHEELVTSLRKAEAQVAEAHERLDEFGMRRDGTTATVVEGIAAMRERVDEYRAEWYRAEAQVAAARAALELRCDQWVRDDVLRAMDEASTTK